MIFWHACMDVSICGHERHHRGILGTVLLHITGGPAKSRKLPLSLSLMFWRWSHWWCCQVTGHWLLPAARAGQLPQLGDDVVEEEVVAPVHHVDQEEHEREEHQGDAVHAVAPEFMRKKEI